jgi:tetratricopeptide (TPR) repeat protein
MAIKSKEVMKMVKKILFAGFISLVLLFCRMTEQCFADAQSQLELAQTYEQDSNYVQAEAIYKTIVTDYPDTNNAMEAQKRLVMLYFTQNKQTEGQTAFEKLISDHSEKEDIAEAVNQIAAHCSDLKMHEKSRQYYQYILDNWPKDAPAIWAKAGVATSNISLEDQQAADIAINELLTDFNDHQYLQKAFFNIAAYSHWVGDYQKARDLCQRSLANWPKGEFAIWAQMDLAASYISLGQEQAAQAAINKLVTDFNDHPKLNWARFVVGQQYYLEERFTEAAAMWEQIMAGTPSFTDDEFAEAYLYMGDCYQRLGQYQKAIESYKKLADNYPNYKYAWHALFSVGYGYQNLKQTGGISASEADAKTRAAYQTLLQQYPDCKAAKAAERWLSGNN